jgi:calpain-5
MLACRLKCPRFRLNGCYEALEGGNATDALVDLTGGIAELFEIDKFRNNESSRLFQFMLKAHRDDAFMTCSVHVCDSLLVQQKVFISDE